MSVKFQVTFPEALMAELKTESERLGIPVAELIRQVIDDRFHRSHRPLKSDPFEAIDGLAKSNETNLASRIDEILYR